MNAATKVVVIDDHPLMAEASRKVNEQMEGVQVVGVAHDGRSGIEAVERLRPDLVLLDYQLPDRDGSELAAAIKALLPNVHVVIFTGMDVSALIGKFLELDVSGVISKGTRSSAIRNMIACILENHIVLPRAYTKQLQMGRLNGPEFELTGEEALLMSLLVKGATLDQIAQRLHISKRSVDNYQRKILDKIGASNRAQGIEKFVQSKYYMEGL
jgi:two-component system competent response regulator ComA